jgi:hypothetical protein
MIKEFLLITLALSSLMACKQQPPPQAERTLTIDEWWAAKEAREEPQAEREREQERWAKGQQQANLYREYLTLGDKATNGSLNDREYFQSWKDEHMRAGGGFQ